MTDLLDVLVLPAALLLLSDLVYVDGILGVTLGVCRIIVSMLALAILSIACIP